MNTKFVPKETDFQRWLDSFKIYLGSEDVELGRTYKGYAEFDGEVVLSRCKAIYYDASQRALLAEDIDSNRYLFLSGRMYAYDEVLRFERCNFLSGKTSLSEFVNSAVEAVHGSLTKEALVEQMSLSVAAKLAGYFKSSFALIADAYFCGSI